MSALTTDVIIIGGGHNGLVCGCYLARTGLKVLIVERRNVIGGSCTTEELIPGFRFDVGAASHIWIRSTPIVKELGLVNYGLKYLELDPLIFAPYQDGKHVEFYKDVEKTVEAIRLISNHDARAYQKMYYFWQSCKKILDPPTATTGPMSFVEMLKQDDNEELSRLMLMSSKRILDEEFETDYVKSQIAWIGATAGLNPAEPGTGALIGHHFMLHDLGIARPAGGSGAFTESLRRAFVAAGGQVILGEHVAKVRVENKNGRQTANGVELASGTRISSKIVISAVDPKQAILTLLPADTVPAEFRRKISACRVINGMGVGTCLAVNDLPKYSVDPSEMHVKCTQSLQSLCPSIDYIEESYSEACTGRISENFSMHISTPTALDSSLAPPGKHTIWIWSMFAPYRLRDNGDWREFKEEAAEKILEIYYRYAPNVKSSIIDRRVFSPADYERMLSIPRGQYGHIDMSLDQMYDMRPLKELNNYSTFIEGYYITGAGTFPGGGVYGAPGRNTAMKVISDVRMPNS